MSDKHENSINDNVNHPKHYLSHPSGIECFDVIETTPNEVSNPIKYLYRKDYKNGLEDVRKSLWYLRKCSGRAYEVLSSHGLFVKNAELAQIVARHEDGDSLLMHALCVLIAGVHETYDEFRACIERAIQRVEQEINEKKENN